MGGLTWIWVDFQPSHLVISLDELGRIGSGWVTRIHETNDAQLYPQLAVVSRTRADWVHQPVRRSRLTHLPEEDGCRRHHPSSAGCIVASPLIRATTVARLVAAAAARCRRRYASTAARVVAATGARGRRR